MIFNKLRDNFIFIKLIKLFVHIDKLKSFRIILFDSTYTINKNSMSDKISIKNKQLC